MPVKVTAVLEDFTAEGTAVHLPVLSRFVSPENWLTVCVMG